MARHISGLRCVALMFLMGAIGAPFDAWAGGLKVKLKGGSFSGYKVVALSKSGSVLRTATVGTNNRATLSRVPGAFSVQLINSENQYAGPAVAGCSRALRKAGCKLSNSKLGVGFSGRQNIGNMNFTKKDAGYFKTTVNNSRQLLRLKSNMRARANFGAPLGNGSNLGRNTQSARLYNASNPADRNRDGVPDVYAADDDGDGIIDNYDSQDNSPNGAFTSAVTESEVRIFSNLKLDIQQSLNVNTGVVPTTSEIDAALSTAGTLAIAVVGDSAAGDTTELDCGALNYCKSGGTGRTVDGDLPFPDSMDADSDGLGEIAAGGTGDFQLRHGAASSEIGAGDTIFEVVTDSSNNVTRVPGMLNFAFNTTPALKTVEVQGGATYNVSYPAANGMLGSFANCFLVPATGPLVLTFTYWRPQRSGNSSLGEGAFVDIGNANYTIDIPNAPCLDFMSCMDPGPGRCDVSLYSTSDPNLTPASNGDGMTDTKVDTDADPANTLQFTLDLTGCLDSMPFASGQKLALDLQAGSRYGDNAAQKFCIERE